MKIFLVAYSLYATFFFFKASVENKRLEDVIDTFANSSTLKIEVVEDLAKRYDACLRRERSRNDLWRRKIENYEVVQKKNKERLELWPRKERPSIQQAFLQAYNLLAISGKSVTGFKLESLISSDVSIVPFLASKQNQ